MLSMKTFFDLFKNLFLKVETLLSLLLDNVLLLTKFKDKLWNSGLPAKSVKKKFVVIKSLLSKKVWYQKKVWKVWYQKKVYCPKKVFCQKKFVVIKSLLSKKVCYQKKFAIKKSLLSKLWNSGLPANSGHPAKSVIKSLLS